MPSVWPPPPYGHALGAIYSRRPRSIVIPPRASISQAAISVNLTDQDRVELALLRDVMAADRYPFSPKGRRLKELLPKLIPAQEPAVQPYPASKPSAQPSHLYAKLKGGRRRR